MKKILTTIAAVCLAGSGFAQTDTMASHQPDTIVVGKFIIVKKNAPGSNNYRDSNRARTFNINFSERHRNNKPSNISTNWLIFDLGFANIVDNTNYATANQSSYLNGGNFSKEDLRLRTIKSSNANLWFFMQKINITKHVLNLKYGLGLEMYNFRYENNISYSNNPAYVYNDSVNFSKDKLYVGYLTVPFMLNINTSPHTNRGFSFSTGISAGYLVGSHTKQVSDARGKQKVHGDFDLNPWRIAYIAELGLGPVHLYGSYSINTLHNEGLTQYPYAVGFRFSNW